MNDTQIKTISGTRDLNLTTCSPPPKFDKELFQLLNEGWELLGSITSVDDENGVTRYSATLTKKSNG